MVIVKVMPGGDFDSRTRLGGEWESWLVSEGVGRRDWANIWCLNCWCACLSDLWTVLIGPGASSVEKIHSDYKHENKGMSM